MSSDYAFVFGEFNVHQREWCNYFGGTDKAAELCYCFYISNYLTRLLNPDGYLSFY